MSGAPRLTRLLARQRLLAAAAGVLAGIGAAQILPVSATLAGILGSAGVGAFWAQAIVTALFAAGGAEAALLVCAFAAQLSAGDGAGDRSPGSGDAL